MALSTTWLWIAAVLSFATMWAHIIVGGRYIARPLLKSEMHAVPKYTNYFVWHMVTIVLGGMSIAFALAAYAPAAWELAIFALVLAIGFCVLNLAVVITRRQSFIYIPQWSFFLLISLAGCLSIWLA